MRVDLALIGFGHVGRRFARLMRERQARLAAGHDLECRIVAIATRGHGAAYAASGLDGVAAADRVESGGSLPPLHANRDGPLPTDAFACIERLSHSPADARIVVEATTLSIEDGRPAIDHVEAALDAGCHVVTANKGPAAFACRRLAALAARADRSFLFEGAVMDGIPIFNLVRETMPLVAVDGFRGVVNTTTNEILSALERGEAFAPALARMQAAGIAEADPRLDLDGWDAAAKAAILANVLFAADLTPHDVARAGIGPATADRARAAFARGSRLRLVASGRRGERPAVRLEELAREDLLAGVSGTANALLLETDLLGELAIWQLGGDLTQTAYALLSDLVAACRHSSAPRAAPARRTP